MRDRAEKRRAVLSVIAIACLVTARAAWAQPPTLELDEMPHVELSVGVGAMFNGPGKDIEQPLRLLHLDQPDGRQAMPSTQLPSLVPGAFAVGHFALARHVTLGFFIGVVESETTGRATGGGEVIADATVQTEALVLSFRPNPWLRLGAGPALHERQLRFDAPLGTHIDEADENALGWMALADAKFARRPGSEGRPPTFGYVTTQYRSVPPLSSPPATLPILFTNGATIAWPGGSLRYSHWMVGFGGGVEF